MLGKEQSSLIESIEGHGQESLQQEKGFVRSELIYERYGRLAINVQVCGYFLILDADIDHYRDF